MRLSESSCHQTVRLIAAVLTVSGCSYGYDVLHETECTGAQDEDRDGLVDCDDPDCADAPACRGPACDDDGVCDTGESCPGCADCCTSPCGPGEGTATDWIVSSLDVPLTVAESRQIGVDLDGDGVVDNQLGGLLGLFPLDVATDIAAGYQRKLQGGRVILIARLWLDAWSGDETAAFQVLPGLADPTLDATEDNLTGSGMALLAPEADRTASLCGELGPEGYAVGPGPFTLPVPILGTITFLTVELARANDATPMGPEALVDLTLGGGLAQDTVENQLIPAMQLTINEEVLENPDGQVAQYVLATLDTACSPTLPGCEGVTPGEGECSAWDHQPTTLPLSLTELRCNPFVRDILAPDIDSDGDQVADLLSVGVRFDAIHITIAN